MTKLSQEHDKATYFSNEYPTYSQPHIDRFP